MEFKLAGQVVASPREGGARLSRARACIEAARAGTKAAAWNPESTSVAMAEKFQDIRPRSLLMMEGEGEGEAETSDAPAPSSTAGVASESARAPAEPDASDDVSAPQPPPPAAEAEKGDEEVTSTQVPAAASSPAVAAPGSGAKEGVSVGSAELYPQQYPASDSLDIEIDKLVYVVEDHAHTLKQALVKRYMGMRKKWHEHEQERILEERRKHHELMQIKVNELDRERYAVHVAKSREQTSRKILLKAILAMRKNRERLGNFASTAMFFKIWQQLPKKRRIFFKSLKRIEHKFSMMLLRKIFQSWRKWTRQTVRTRIEEVIYERHKKGFDEEVARLTEHIDALHVELRDTKAELNGALAQREKTEKNMKQAFMRGLCAMNIEAMSMMKQGSFTSLASILQDGVNENAE